MWRHNKSSTCRNVVAAELVARICQKIENNERFAAYIVIPMWPSGGPVSKKVQEILQWQSLTIESMYREIARCIKKQTRKMQSQGKTFTRADPRDYLNFYCLGSRETVDGSQATFKPRPGSAEELVAKSRRFMVYVHSKMCIFDDEVVIIGSANINERSLAGTRNTEISNASWQAQHLASKESIARGDVHLFRLQCWSHLTGTMEEIFRDPSCLACVRRVNELAQNNWNLFTQKEPGDMTSSILPYPITINQNGRLRGATKSGKFPDTKGKILGKLSIIPNLLTT